MIAGPLSDVVISDYLVLPYSGLNPIVGSVFTDKGECISLIKDFSLMEAVPVEEPANVICYLGDMDDTDMANIRIRFLFAAEIPTQEPNCIVNFLEFDSIIIL